MSRSKRNAALQACIIFLILRSSLEDPICYKRFLSTLSCLLICNSRYSLYVVHFSCIQISYVNSLSFSLQLHVGGCCKHNNLVLPLLPFYCRYQQVFAIEEVLNKINAVEEEGHLIVIPLLINSPWPFTLVWRQLMQMTHIMIHPHHHHPALRQFLIIMIAIP